VLQSGITLPRARLAYKTYGKLAATRDNAIVMPTFYGGRHIENEAMMGAGRALDPARWLIIVPNMFGNGLSSSPSNTPPPFDRAAFPNVTGLTDAPATRSRTAVTKSWTRAAHVRLALSTISRSSPCEGHRCAPTWPVGNRCRPGQRRTPAPSIDD
jgi:hypothetical protein